MLVKMRGGRNTAIQVNTFLGNLMTDTNNQSSGDSKADAIAAIATVLIVLTAVVYWVYSY
ncbi:MAG: hypothetical protein ACPG5F_03460 [Porticoccaceae bacterium]